MEAITSGAESSIHKAGRTLRVRDHRYSHDHVAIESACGRKQALCLRPKIALASFKRSPAQSPIVSAMTCLLESARASNRGGAP